MAGRCVLILGGARSGKSSLAQTMARQHGQKVLFVATGAPLDDEMALRIEEHKRQRPHGWRTLEATTDVARKVMAELHDAEVVVVDCITLLVSNILLGGRGPDSEGPDELDRAAAEDRVTAEVEGLIDCLSTGEAVFIIVSNEVGMGLVPVYKSGRDYRDLLGKANQLLARHASEVYFMVSGIPVKIRN
jgi:adenosylcobinamide kinase/adenosylcobinamide-phosphate guanylyltransferase